MDNFELMKKEAEQTLRKPDLKTVRSIATFDVPVNAWSLRTTITFIQYMTVGQGQFIKLKRISPRVWYFSSAGNLLYELSNFHLEPVLQTTSQPAFNNIDYNALTTEFPGILIAPGYPGYVDVDWPLVTERGQAGGFENLRQIAWQLDLVQPSLPAGVVPGINDAINGQCEFEFISF
jgi:hypothetical protein